MQNGYAPVKYVYSRLTVYYSSLIDLRCQRSVHSCSLCRLTPLQEHALQCGAIHHGVCTPVTTPIQLTSNGPKPRAKVKAKAKLHILRQAPKEDVHLREKDLNARTSNHKRGEPDGQPDFFLKAKEAQLREKRERENKSKAPNRTETETKKDTVEEKIPVLVNGEKGEEPSKEQSQPPSQRQSRVLSQNLSEHIPQFHFPMGRPAKTDQVEAVAQRVSEAFSKLEGGKAHKQHVEAITKACGLPLYWKSMLFNAAGGEKNGYITLQTFLAVWRKVTSTYHDDAARFVRLLAKPGCSHLVAEDFVPLIQDVVDTHPGLTFLLDAPEFHSRYVHTVIARIFYCVNRSWSGRISIQEIRRSNLLQTLQLLEEEEDINQITDYFSYEHFYVIYCKFWELDKDHDLFIDREDLGRHNDHAISSRIIDRIFSGAVTRGRTQKEGKMSYTEFVWFLISEEDKRHPTSIEYWFRCMDLDGDGYISMYEMEYFYEEQVQKMEALGIETLPFEDCLCQMLDMVKPKEECKITLSDLKKCKMTPIFFDTFFNLEKYLDHEQKDPFANDNDEPEMSDWERYTAEEYEILVAEEGSNDGVLDEIAYEDDFEPDDEEIPTLPSDTPLHLTDAIQRKQRPRSTSPEDDLYDFNTKDLGY